MPSCGGQRRTGGPPPGYLRGWRWIHCHLLLSCFCSLLLSSAHSQPGCDWPRWGAGAFYEAVASLLSVVDKKAVLENLDLVLLCLCHLLLSCFCSLLMSSAYHQPEGLSFGATGKALPHLAGDEDPAAGPLARAYSVLEAVHTKFFAGPAGGDVATSSATSSSASWTACCIDWPSN